MNLISLLYTALRGTVESVFETGGNDTSKGAKFYSVKIEKIFRGKRALLNATGQASIPTGSSIYVQTQRESPACGATFSLNTDYVITGIVCRMRLQKKIWSCSNVN